MNSSFMKMFTNNSPRRTYIEEEFENTLMKIYDGGFKRRIITDQASWKEVILVSKRCRGWAGTEDCNSEEEEFNNNWDAIGPCMIGFGHIGPDKEDPRVERRFRINHNENYWLKVRDKHRNYGRAPFFKPRTTQEEFYSKTLEGLTAAIGSARKLRNLDVGVRFDDGVIPCFIIDPVNYALASLNKAWQAVNDTIEVLDYDKDKLKYKVERKNQIEEERRTKPRQDMAGTRDRLRSLARSTHEQTKNVGQYMERSKEWLVADDWKFAKGTIEDARRNIACLQQDPIPFFSV